MIKKMLIISMIRHLFYRIEIISKGYFTIIYVDVIISSTTLSKMTHYTTKFLTY
jgi:hypothetical protein